MSTQSVRGRIASRDAHLRAADADREQIADELRTGHTEGRLDLAEFQQRLDCCYEARTFGELGALVADLPRGDEPRHPARQSGPRGGRGRVVIACLVLAVLLMAASTASYHDHHPPFFLVFPLLFLVWRLSWLRRAHWSTGSRGGPGRWT